MKPLIVLGLIAAAVPIGLTLMRSGAAGKPAMFAEGLTLASAVERSKSSGRPVFAYATADWCGPCQHFKANTLSHPAITALVQERTHAAYVDVERDAAGAEALSVTSIPAFAILRNGLVVAKGVGAMPPDEFQSWLKAALESTPESAEGAEADRR